MELPVLFNYYMMSADMTSKAVVAEHKWSPSAAAMVERPPCYNWRKSLTPTKIYQSFFPSPTISLLPFCSQRVCDRRSLQSRKFFKWCTWFIPLPLFIFVLFQLCTVTGSVKWLRCRHNLFIF